MTPYHGRPAHEFKFTGKPAPVYTGDARAAPLQTGVECPLAPESHYESPPRFPQALFGPIPFLRGDPGRRLNPRHERDNLDEYTVDGDLHIVLIP
jgi:hypothetical protein